MTIADLIFFFVMGAIVIWGYASLVSWARNDRGLSVVKIASLHFSILGRALALGLMALIVFLVVWWVIPSVIRGVLADAKWAFLFSGVSGDFLLAPLKFMACLAIVWLPTGFVLAILAKLDAKRSAGDALKASMRDEGAETIDSWSEITDRASMIFESQPSEDSRALLIQWLEAKDAHNSK